MDPLLVRFYRQYMQQIPNLTFPPSKLLLELDIQDQIYRHFFHDATNSHHVYQRRVLKQIISLIERAMKDPDEDVILSYPHLTCRRIVPNIRSLSARYGCASIVPSSPCY